MYPDQWCLKAGKPALARKTACRRARRKKKVQLYYYKCPHCDGWHVTSLQLYQGKENIKPPRVT